MTRIAVFALMVGANMIFSGVALLIWFFKTHDGVLAMNYFFFIFMFAFIPSQLSLAFIANWINLIQSNNHQNSKNGHSSDVDRLHPLKPIVLS